MPDTAPIPATLRWTGALTIVLALHAAAAWLLLTRVIAPISLPAAPEAVMLDLAPDPPPIQPAAIVPPATAVPLAAPMAPQPIPTPEPPPVPEPLPTPDLPPLALPPTPLPPQPKPKPKPTPPPRRIERQTTPPVAEAVERPIQPIAPAPVQTAPQAPSRPQVPASSTPSSWRSDLLGRLQHAKRYPDLARSRGDQGVATISFTIDRAGRVLDVTLVRSSGSSLLDEEAAALVRRAEPLPRLPDEIAGTSLTLTVPISFTLR